MWTNSADCDTLAHTHTSLRVILLHFCRVTSRSESIFSRVSPRLNQSGCRVCVCMYVCGNFFPNNPNTSHLSTSPQPQFTAVRLHTRAFRFTSRVSLTSGRRRALSRGRAPPSASDQSACSQGLSGWPLISDGVGEVLGGESSASVDPRPSLVYGFGFESGAPPPPRMTRRRQD